MQQPLRRYDKFFSLTMRVNACSGVICRSIYYAHSNGVFAIKAYRPLSRRLDRCNREFQNESSDPFGGNVHYVTMQITFLTRKFRNGERNLHCDVVHITTKWVSSLTLDCNGVFAIKAYYSVFGSRDIIIARRSDDRKCSCNLSNGNAQVII